MDLFWKKKLWGLGIPDFIADSERLSTSDQNRPFSPDLDEVGKSHGRKGAGTPRHIAIVLGTYIRGGTKPVYVDFGTFLGNYPTQKGGELKKVARYHLF